MRGSEEGVKQSVGGAPKAGQRGRLLAAAVSRIRQPNLRTCCLEVVCQNMGVKRPGLPSRRRPRDDGSGARKNECARTTNPWGYDRVPLPSYLYANHATLLDKSDLSSLLRRSGVRRAACGVQWRPPRKRCSRENLGGCRLSRVTPVFHRHKRSGLLCDLARSALGGIARLESTGARKRKQTWAVV